MICHNCGGQLPDGALKCDRCGNVFHPAQTVTPVVAASAIVPLAAIRPTAPISPSPAPATSRSSPIIVEPASRIRRFFNLMIDVTTLSIVSLLAGTFVHFQSLWLSFLFGIVLNFLYYVFFESLWQKSPGKFITGTKVVTYSGVKPTVGAIALRSLCRQIPFEAFSFLHTGPVGWHDRFSGTLVVPKKYTESEVQRIDVKAHYAGGWAIVAGVIFIILLIVIGLGASILLASINSARQLGRDAKRVADVRVLQLGLELYHDDHNQYPMSL